MSALRLALVAGVALWLVLGAGAQARDTDPVQGDIVDERTGWAAEIVPVVTEGNLNRAITRLKQAGFWIYGAALEGRPLGEVRFNGPLLLVVGSEGEGIRRKTREHADELVRIPQAPGGVASLNASCATAVLLHEISRRFSG